MSEQPALFPGLEAPEPKRLRRHAEMLWLYGRCEGHHCRECGHLVRKLGGAGVFFKCAIAGVSDSAATDWRGKFEACGKFEQGE